MGFDLALGGFELGLQRLDMAEHALLDGSSHAPSFQAIAGLPQHVLHIIATMQERTQAHDLSRHRSHSAEEWLLLFSLTPSYHLKMSLLGIALLLSGHPGAATVGEDHTDESQHHRHHRSPDLTADQIVGRGSEHVEHQPQGS